MFGPPGKGISWPLKETSTAPAFPVKKTIWSVARTVFTSGGLISPRTAYLPSDLIEIHARSFARTATSKGGPDGVTAPALVESVREGTPVAGIVLSGAAAGLRPVAIDAWPGFAGWFVSLAGDVFVPAPGWVAAPAWGEALVVVVPLVPGSDAEGCEPAVAELFALGGGGLALAARSASARAWRSCFRSW